MSIIKSLLKKFRNQEREPIVNPYPSSKAAFDRYNYLEAKKKQEEVDYEDLQEETEKENFDLGTKMLQEEIDKTTDQKMRDGLVKKYLERMTSKPSNVIYVNDKPKERSLLEEIEMNQKNQEKKETYEREQINKISDEIKKDMEQQSKYLNRTQLRNPPFYSISEKLAEAARQKEKEEKRSIDATIKANIKRIDELQAKDALTSSEKSELQSLRDITTQLLNGSGR